MYTLKVFFTIPGRVRGNITTYPVILYLIPYSKAISHHGAKASQLHSRAHQGAGGNDVVVEAGVGLVLVEVRQRQPLGLGQVAQAEQVPVKALACTKEKQL